MPVCLLICHPHGLATHSVSALSCRIGRKGRVKWFQQSQNTGSRVAASRGRGMLSIHDNLKAMLIAIKPALLLKYNFEL